MKHKTKDEQIIASFKHERRTNKTLPTNKLSIEKDTCDITNYKSFTIDLTNPILVKGCHEIITYLSQLLDVEIKYVIEKKIKNNQAHIHGYFESKNSISILKKTFHQILYGSHYDLKKTFSLSGWKSYITKENQIVHSVGQSF